MLGYVAAAAAAEYIDPRLPAANLGYPGKPAANRVGSQSLKFTELVSNAPAADTAAAAAAEAAEAALEIGGETAAFPPFDPGLAEDARLVALNEDRWLLFGVEVGMAGLMTGLAVTLPMVESLAEANPLPWLPPESAPGKHEVMLSQKVSLK